MRPIPFLLALALGSCSRSLAAELEAAGDGSAEARALGRVARECAPLTLSVEDATGNPLPVSGPRFPMDVKRIHVGGRCKLDHAMLEPKNVLILMRE